MYSIESLWRTNIGNYIIRIEQEGYAEATEQIDLTAQLLQAGEFDYGYDGEDLTVSRSSRFSFKIRLVESISEYISVWESLNQNKWYVKVISESSNILWTGVIEDNISADPINRMFEIKANDGIVYSSWDSEYNTLNFESVTLPDQATGDFISIYDTNFVGLGGGVFANIRGIYRALARKMNPYLGQLTESNIYTTIIGYIPDTSLIPPSRSLLNLNRIYFGLNCLFKSNYKSYGEVLKSLFNNLAASLFVYRNTPYILPIFQRALLSDIVTNIPENSTIGTPKFSIIDATGSIAYTFTSHTRRSGSYPTPYSSTQYFPVNDETTHNQAKKKLTLSFPFPIGYAFDTKEDANAMHVSVTAMGSVLGADYPDDGLTTRLDGFMLPGLNISINLYPRTFTSLIQAALDIIWSTVGSSRYQIEAELKGVEWPPYHYYTFHGSSKVYRVRAIKEDWNKNTTKLTLIEVRMPEYDIE